MCYQSFCCQHMFKASCFWMTDHCLLMCVFRYDNPLSPLGQHISSELGLTKRHFFEIPSPHCNLDLDEYEYEDDYEWCSISKRFLFSFLFFFITSLLSTVRFQKQSSELHQTGDSQVQAQVLTGGTGHTTSPNRKRTQNQKTMEGSDVLTHYQTWITGNVIKTYSEQVILLRTLIFSPVTLQKSPQRTSCVTSSTFRFLLHPHMLTQEKVCFACNYVWSECCFV